MKIKFLPIFFPALLCVSMAFGQHSDTLLTRSIDGRFNNLEHPEWGAAGTNLLRATTIAYDDGVSTPAIYHRPNPRDISNSIFAQSGSVPDPLGLSDFTWAFGQFIDHDIGLTPDGGEPAFIEVPSGDRHFDPFRTGQVVIPMMRNRHDPNTGGSTSNPRQHPNLITSFIDGSGVYGSDEETANWLRTFEGGKLKTSAGNYLPYNTISGEFDDEIDHDAPELDNPVGLTDKLFVAGDVRVNENPLLTSFHLLFVREHNLLCEELAEEHPSWTDEELYQHARRIVSGKIQSIVYNEWLPTMGVNLPAYSGYKADVNPGLMNVFTAAAYRLGHTLINGTLMRLDEEGNPIPEGPISLRDAFFNPPVLPAFGIETYLRGMAVQTQQRFDAQLVDDVRNFLFGPPGSGGLDLASININRGRERGLPDYNTVRENFGLTPYRVFHQINSDVTVATRLMIKYLSVNWLDPWVGMLAETPLPGTLFGETITTILTEQFGGLRDGDRFFYLNDPILSDEEKDMIHQTRMRDVIYRNTEVKNLQPNVFRATSYTEDDCQVMDKMLVSVTLENGNPVPNVETTMTMTAEEKSSATDENGEMVFESIPSCEVASLSFAKADDAGNGLSTLDIILAQKHILGVQYLSSPYQMLAADVDNSKAISTLDLIYMRKVVLGVETSFPGNVVWEFLPADYAFQNPLSPLTEELPINNMPFDDQPNTTYSFIGVKKGDLNGSVDMSEASETVAPRSNEVTSLVAKDYSFEAGELVAVELAFAPERYIAGYQFSLSFDQESFTFVELANTNIEGLGADNFAVFNDRGLLNTSWNTNGQHAIENGRFTLMFRAENAGKVSDFLSLDTRLLTPEAYDADQNVASLALNFESAEPVAAAFQVYQNEPNPFVGETMIPFDLDQEGQVKLKVHNLLGQLVFEAEQNFSTGRNYFLLDARQIGLQGILEYTIETDQHSQTFKMIVSQN